MLARFTALAIIFLTGFPALAGGAAQGKMVLDLWDAAYLQGGRAGYVHTWAQEFESGGQKLLKTTIELRLTLKRNKETIQLAMDNGSLETPGGKVTGVFLRHFLGQTKTLEITGQVKGNQLHLVRDQKIPMDSAPWDDRVVGLYRQQHLFQEKQVKPGDTFSILSYEPSISLVVTTHVQVKDYEAVEMFGGREKRRLLRVESKPEKVQNFQLPTMLLWLDEQGQPLRSQVEIPGLGSMVLYRTTKAAALAPGSSATLTDIGLSQLIRVNKKIPQPYETAFAVFRITVKEDEDPTTVFSRDSRQEVKNTKGNIFELHVRAQGKSEEEKKIGAEFTQSSYFINSADPLVKEHARKAVGLEKDPWKKALRIERWVNDHMTPTNHEALSTADHVARTLKGDCTEFAMLMAAMCRAEGIPSRTAVGLIYADLVQGPVFAFHMWTEVWHQGRWLALDATLARGAVGATHLKISDQSWHNETSLAPLLPVMRALGRVSLEAVRIEYRP